MAQVYPQMNESSHRETGVHLRTPAHMPYSNNVPLPGHPSPEYDRTQVPAGPPRSMARQPHTFHITFPLAPPLVLATSRHISRSNDDRPTAPRSKLQYKDLRYDGKSNWKAFFHKFVRLSRSQLWTKAEQHDQVCFSWRAQPASTYTLLLEVCPRPQFRIF